LSAIIFLSIALPLSERVASSQFINTATPLD